MSRARQGRAAWVWAFALLAALMALPAAGAAYDAREAAYACAVEEAPRWERSTGGTVVESRGRATLWPLGRECVLTTADGERVVLDQGWLATSFLVLAAVAALGALGVGVLGVPCRRRMHA